MYLAVEGGVLAVADHDVAHGAALEFDDGHGGIFHFDVGVVQILPDAVYFIDVAHVPQQQVELMGCLVDQNAAAFALPGAAHASLS